MGLASDYEPSKDEGKNKYGTNRFWLPREVGESLVVKLLPGFDPSNDNPINKKPFAYYRYHKVDISLLGQEEIYARRVICMDQNMKKADRDTKKKIPNVLLTVENALVDSTRFSVMEQIEALKRYCPICALSKKLELTYFTRKAEGAPKEVVDALWKKFMDSKAKSIYIFNAVDKNMNYGLLEINPTTFQKLENIILPKAREQGLSLYSSGPKGVWLKFTKVSNERLKDNYTVEINKEFREFEGGIKAEVTDTQALAANVLSKIETQCLDLDRFYENSMLSMNEALQIFSGESFNKNMSAPKDLKSTKTPMNGAFSGDDTVSSDTVEVDTSGSSTRSAKDVFNL